MLLRGSYSILKELQVLQYICFGELEFIVRGYTNLDFAFNKKEIYYRLCIHTCNEAVRQLSKLQTVVALSTIKA